MKTLASLIETHYGIRVHNLSRVCEGAGGDVYYADTGAGRFVLKGTVKSDIYACNEPRLAKYLAAQGIPVPAFLPTKDGADFFRRGKWQYNLRPYVEWTVYGYNEAPAWLITESAQMLGRIHHVLAAFEPLPMGIGPDFFAFLRSDAPRISYIKTLSLAKAAGEDDVAADVEFRLSRLHKLQEQSYDYARFTRGNTHGDYKISQIVCREGHIAAIIDWTSACRHPLCWEVIRSYAHAAPEGARGAIDSEGLRDYLAEYTRYAPLTDYDLRMMPYFYRDQLLACDYYGQYYASKGQNRMDYLAQARFATGVLRVMDF